MKRTISALLIAIFILNCGQFLFAEPLNGAGVQIDTGEFVMGDTYCLEEQDNADWCRDEVPHKVQLDSYLIDKYEVTNADYSKCFAVGACGPHPLHEDRPKEFDGPKQPVVFVTWEDANSYCQWKGGRLPTEAEWERAAQGKELGGAHFGKKYRLGSPRGVGELSPNSKGLYDMLGNVNEWTQDWYGPFDTAGVSVNPKGPASGKDKVIRGGSWNSLSHYLRVSDRVARSPELRYSDVGFRCVFSLSGKG
ncbi:MAG: SUMF1/EgtB/PvdO family nonheme iron enzyme [Nitrospinae bacterium]|jgi:formylglycine-generating enzyme|nr:SUMF1/EgtB/PvdO family nonheme iron enzyme [Nitrospinota bacterium]MDA1110348.1 SUMF1/EgtB/PvdO family nonheme iron enzyme [Nitrospinota bacterium]